MGITVLGSYGSKLFLRFSKAVKVHRKVHKTASCFQQKGSTKDDQFCNLSSPDKIDPIVGYTMPEFLWSNLSKWENSPAYTCSSTGRTYSHGEVYKYSRNFAAALKQSGLTRNDVVVILLPNVPEFIIALLGMWEAGLIPCSFNPAYTSDEIARQSNVCEAKAIITTPELLPSVQQARSQCQSMKLVITIGRSTPPAGCHSFLEMMNVNSEGVTFMKGSDMNSLEDIAMLSFSSGTTGPPKGVMLTATNIATNLHQITHSGYIASDFFMNGNPQERFLGVLPLFHIYGFLTFVGCNLYQGAHTMLVQKFEPDSFINAIRRHKPTVLHLVPPLVSFLATFPDVKKDDFSATHSVIAAAAPIGTVLINKLIEKAGKNIYFQEGLGMTEVLFSHIMAKKIKTYKTGSCGVVLPSTMCKIVSLETGESLGPNEKGEMCIKGPQVMKGYFKNEKATKEIVDSEGWLHTGDIGIYDEDGLFYVVDRLKELIKVKGLQVAPSELENLLRDHPMIADVAVIGVPDERSGELPRAYIVPKDKNLTEEVVHEFLSTKVAAHKKLKGGVEFIDVIPKSASGKILRKDLKKEYLSIHP